MMVMVMMVMMKVERRRRMVAMTILEEGNGKERNQSKGIYVAINIKFGIPCPALNLEQFL